MRWMRTVAREVLGLFVDDGSFAFAILIWLTLMWFGLPRLQAFVRWRGVILFAGLGLILIESTVRTAKRHWTKETHE